MILYFEIPKSPGPRYKRRKLDEASLKFAFIGSTRRTCSFAFRSLFFSCLRARAFYVIFWAI